MPRLGSGSGLLGLGVRCGQVPRGGAGAELPYLEAEHRDRDAERQVQHGAERAAELDVLRLIAAGLSNAEIASKLFVSQGTVKTHVTRILTKLALRDRVQAAVLAYETCLIRPGTVNSPEA